MLVYHRHGATVKTAMIETALDRRGALQEFGDSRGLLAMARFSLPPLSLALYTQISRS